MSKEPDSASMRAAREIVDYLALPDSAEPADSNGSPTEYIAKIIARHVGVERARAFKEAAAIVKSLYHKSEVFSRWNKAIIETSATLERAASPPEPCTACGKGEDHFIHGGRR